MVIPKKRETNKENPITTLAYCVVSRTETGNLPSLGDRGGQRGQNSHRQGTREERTTYRETTFRSSTSSLQLSADQSMCVRKGPEARKRTGRKQQAQHFLEHTQGWNRSRRLVTHESSG